MIILGIDPGTATTGYGVIEAQGNNIRVIDYGCISTKAGLELAERLETINLELEKLIKEHQPAEVAVEELFFATNAKTAMAVGQARGVILLTAKKNNCPIYEYTPLEVKNTVCGYGGAEKKQIQKMVQMLCKLSEEPRPDDAADALAIAICHAACRKMNVLN
jgi:crossover junction endodeoxyribonuclease RuvC